MVCYEHRVSAPTVALDVTPLIGVRTGIANAVAATFAALMTNVDPPIVEPYALSLRAREHRSDVPDSTHFPPIPARLAIRSWARSEWPRIDRWLGGADVLHATNYLTPPSRLPTVVTIHDCAFVRYPELASAEVRALEPVVRRAIRRGAIVHTPSEFVAQEVDEIFGSGLRRGGRIVVIPWGIPAVFPDLGLSEAIATRIGARPFVLSLGTLEPRKNLPHLVAAFGRFAHEHVDALLVIAGPDGTASRSVADATTRLPDDVASRVIRIGTVDDRDRSALLHRARTLAYPSISEGFGFPVLEAMIAGTPVVAARAGSIPEIAGDAALLVDATDEEALASALDAVFRTDTGDDLAVRGRRRAERYDWSVTANGLLDLYRQLA
jgi:glycosyltransferase involved in cell wall biosynthesis